MMGILKTLGRTKDEVSETITYELETELLSKCICSLTCETHNEINRLQTFKLEFAERGSSKNEEFNVVLEFTNGKEV